MSRVFLPLLIGGWAIFLLPFRLIAAEDRFEINPSLGIREEYNDNIFFTTQNEEDDFITTIIPGLEIKSPSRGICWEVDYRLEALFYSHNKDEENTGHDLEALVRYSPSKKFSVSLKEEYLRSKERWIGTTTTGRDYYSRNRLSPQIRYRPWPKTYFELGYQHETFDFEERGFSDSKEEGVLVRWDYGWLPKTFLSGEYQYVQRRYDESRDISLYTYSLGLEHRMTSKIKGRAEFGRETIDSFGGKFEDSTVGLTLAGTFPRTTLTMEFNERSYVTGHNEDVLRTKLTSLAWERKLRRRTTLFLLGFHSFESYRISKNEDEYKGLNIKLSHKFGRQFEGNIRYDYLEVDPSDREEVTNNIYSLGLTFTY